MDFWTNVKNILEERKISQSQFAGDIGINLKTVQNYFYRKTLPDVVVGVTISKYLKVPLEVLIGQEAECLTVTDDSEKELVEKYRKMPEVFQKMYLSMSDKFLEAEI